MNAPASDHEQLLTSWLAVIGMLTMYWSPVERHIDLCVHLLHLKLVAQKRKNKPLNLSRKLGFIKSNLSVAIIDTQELEALTQRTLTTVKIRDVCVHGVLNSYDQQKIEIGKIDGKSDEHLIEVFTIDRERLERSATALSLLQQQWGSIASALLENP